LCYATGLEQPVFEPKEVKKSTESRKRKEPTPSSDTEDSAETAPAKVIRVAAHDEDSEATEGPRRSARNAGKKPSYQQRQEKALEPLYAKQRRALDPELGPVGREDGKRLHDPCVYGRLSSSASTLISDYRLLRKTFGSIPGIAVGTWWEGRYVRVARC
jgi:E3 ubiquitin-protein ligase UHRF1